MSMVIVLVAMLLVGEAAWRSRDARLLIITIGSLFIIMALQRGYYWHIFERFRQCFTDSNPIQHESEAERDTLLLRLTE